MLSLADAYASRNKLEHCTIGITANRKVQNLGRVRKYNALEVSSRSYFCFIHVPCDQSLIKQGECT